MKTIIDKTSGKVLYSTVTNVELKENEVSIDAILTENFINPFYNFETSYFYEGATDEEIAQANKLLVPFSVSKRQLKQALVLSGIPLANIDYAISQIQTDIERELMFIFWNDSNEFERNHPKLIEFSQSLGMSEEQADGLFILASTL